MDQSGAAQAHLNKCGVGIRGGKVFLRTRGIGQNFVVEGGAEIQMGKERLLNTAVKKR